MVTFHFIQITQSFPLGLLPTALSAGLFAQLLRHSTHFCLLNDPDKDYVLEISGKFNRTDLCINKQLTFL